MSGEPVLPPPPPPPPPRPDLESPPQPSASARPSVPYSKYDYALRRRQPAARVSPGKSQRKKAASPPQQQQHARAQRSVTAPSTSGPVRRTPGRATSPVERRNDSPRRRRAEPPVPAADAIPPRHSSPRRAVPSAVYAPAREAPPPFETPAPAPGGVSPTQCRHTAPPLGTYPHPQTDPYPINLSPRHPVYQPAPQGELPPPAVARPPPPIPLTQYYDPNAVASTVPGAPLLHDPRQTAPPVGSLPLAPPVGLIPPPGSTDPVLAAERASLDAQLDRLRDGLSALRGATASPAPPVPVPPAPPVPAPLVPAPVAPVPPAPAPAPVPRPAELPQPDLYQRLLATSPARIDAPAAAPPQEDPALAAAAAAGAAAAADDAVKEAAAAAAAATPATIVVKPQQAPAKVAYTKHDYSAKRQHPGALGGGGSGGKAAPKVSTTPAAPVPRLPRSHAVGAASAQRPRRTASGSPRRTPAPPVAAPAPTNTPGEAATAWSRLVEKTAGTFSASDLEVLYWPTLRDLCVHYGLTDPVDIAAIELEWKRRQPQYAPGPQSASRLQ